MTSAKLFAASALAVSGIVFIGCDNDNATPSGTGTRTTRTETTTDNNARTAADRTGNTLNKAADRTGDALHNAADKTGDAVHTAADKTGNAVKNAGDAIGVRSSTTQPSANAIIRDQKKIRDVLQEVTQAALTKDGFDDIVERFHKDDRQRLHDYANNNKFDDINGVVQQINDAWKAKFGSEFKIKDRDAVFNDQWANVQEGSRDLARTASERQGPGAGAAVNVDVDKNKASADVNLNPGDQTADRSLATTGDRDYAVVMIKASHGAPNVNINMVYDGLLRGYKIDVPDKLDGRKLHDNLLTHLNHINSMKDQWPSDVNDAERAVAHHILAAISDAPISGGSAGNTGNANQ